MDSAVFKWAIEAQIRLMESSGAGEWHQVSLELSEARKALTFGGAGW